MQLFPYQEVAKNKLLEWTNENNTDIVNTLVGVVSSGKTAITCTAIGELYNQNKRVWIVCNRVELVDQWYSELQRFSHHLPLKAVGFIGDKRPIHYSRPIQIVQAQTLIHRLKNINDSNRPHVVFCDESHELFAYRIITKLRNRWNFKNIGLTGSPAWHGKKQVQYSDIYKKDTWFNVISAKEMISTGRWKKPIWISASDELALETERRFSGMKMCGGEYDDTAQSDVMIDLLPFHWDELKDKLGNRSVEWFCVDTKHAIAVYKLLVSKGRKSAFVSGDDKVTLVNVQLPGIKNERKEIVEACREGLITDYITVGTGITGLDVPVLSLEVWLRRTFSITVFVQGFGRVVRKHPDNDEALCFDLAGNLALHPFPEDIDWWDFDPCTKMYRDSNLVMCKNPRCNHRHDSLPKPLHPTDKKTLFGVASGSFNDGLVLSPKEVIVCQSCNEPVYFNFEKLMVYSEWLKQVKAAAINNKKPEQFRNKLIGAGISIGRKNDSQNETRLLKIEDMYEIGLWVLSDTKNERVKNKDRSEEWSKLRKKTIERFSNKDLRLHRLNKLSEVQQTFINTTPVSKLLEMGENESRYRAALGYCYIADRSPLKAWSYWKGEGNPGKEISITAFTNLMKENPCDTYELLFEWLVTHLEKTEDQKRKGVIRGLLKNLATLKPFELIEEISA